MLISLVIKVIFPQCLCSLNLHLNINVWICIFMWEKTSSKESKVDSRTYFADDDLLTTDMTSWWSLKSLSHETHCPFKVMAGPDVSVTPGPISWIFWAIEMLWIKSVYLKANFRNFEGVGISGSHTHQLDDPFHRKIGPDRKIPADNPWGS